MAQKAAKTTAKRNAETLNRTHLIALLVHAFFTSLRVLIFRSSFTRRSFYLYSCLSLPALAIEFLFERNSRPKYRDGSDGSELRTSGDDLEAKGMTEWMWDVIYWSWGCTVLAAIFGDWVWWSYIAIPVYSAYLAFSTYSSVRQGMSGAGGLGTQSEGASGGNSKRQQKMEKRGGQRMQYR